MTKVNIQEAKSKLSQLVDQAIEGEEVIIARAGKAVAKLTALPPKKQKRKLGILDGRKFRIPDDFNKPLPLSVRRSFEGGK